MTKDKFVIPKRASASHEMCNASFVRYAQTFTSFRYDIK